MSDPTGKLDPETRRRIFTDHVVPRSALPKTTPQAQPHAIVLAGQPGAGKGNLERAAQIEFSGNIVTIDADAQREFHPDVKQLREAHPYTWSEMTMRDAAIAGRRNFVDDTTLGNADSAIKNMKALQAQGYSVEVRAIAAHRLESELGVDRRFTGHMDLSGHGRHVPDAVHAKVYNALPGNLDKVQAETGVRIRIYSREGEQLYDSHTSPLKPGVALEQAREARMANPRTTRITSERFQQQQLWHQALPESLHSNPKVSPETAKNLPPEHQALKVAQGVERSTAEAVAVDRAVRIEPGAARVALGVKAAGAAAGLYDAYDTTRSTARLVGQGNVTAAQSQVLHFAGRNLGMVGGAVAVGSMAAAAGVETGPGAVVAGLAGGIVGAVAGDKIMDAADRLRIDNQRGSDGHRWHLDRKHPERGWSRTVQTREIDPHAIPNPVTGEPAYKTRTLQADARLADELNYKASSTAVELALAHAPTPTNPFSQPAGPGDAPAPDATPWTRDAASRQWSRYVPDPAMAAMGVAVGSTEQASPQRSAQLDRAAQATIAGNIALGAQAIAQRYQADYDQYGWKQHGPMPAAVIDAQQAPSSRQKASDGHDYTQGRNGQWTTPGILYGTRAAQGHVHDALDATRDQIQASPRIKEPRHTPLPGRMRFDEAHRRRDEPERISPGSLRPVEKLPKADRMHELTLLREIGIVNARTTHEHGSAPSPQSKPQASVQRAPSGPAVGAPARGEHAQAHPASAHPVDPRDPRNPTHPDHGDFQKIYAVVAQSGQWDARQSINIAAHALAEFKADRTARRLDVVAVEPDTNGQLKVFAGYAPWGEKRGCLSIAAVDPEQAARVPAEQGFDRLAQAGQQQAWQEQMRMEHAPAQGQGMQR